MSSTQRPVPPAGAVAPPPPVEAVPAPRPRRWDPVLLAAVSLGGIVGAEGRYALSLAVPHQPGQLPVATWITNVTGCLLIGVLMVVATELTAPHRLVRPFLGTGVLGGYTTFSTATVEVQQLGQHGRPGLALGYLLGTVLAALIAVTLGTAAARAVGVVWRRRRGGRS